MTNAWFMILGRRLNQWVRRVTISHKRSRKLRDEWIHLSCHGHIISDSEEARIRRIKWELGIKLILDEREKQDRLELSRKGMEVQ